MKHLFSSRDEYMKMMPKELKYFYLVVMIILVCIISYQEMFLMPSHEIILSDLQGINYSFVFEKHNLHASRNVKSIKAIKNRHAFEDQFMIPKNVLEDVYTDISQYLKGNGWIKYTVKIIGGGNRTTIRYETYCKALDMRSVELFIDRNNLNYDILTSIRAWGGGECPKFGEYKIVGDAMMILWLMLASVSAVWVIFILYKKSNMKL